MPQHAQPEHSDADASDRDEPESRRAGSGGIKGYVIAGIFSVLAAIAGAVAATVYADIKALAHFAAPGNAREKAVAGRWVGEAKQAYGPDGTVITYPIEFDLGWQGRKIVGTYQFVFADKSRSVNERVRLQGGMFQDRFVKLEYLDDESGKVQYSTIYLELDDGGDALRGMEVGYGYSSKRITHSAVELKKLK